MPNNKIKSSKKLGRLDNVHPYSRKAKQVQRALLRDDKLAKLKHERGTIRTTPIVDRFLWFKHAVDPDVKCLTREQAYALVEIWLSRHDDEIATLEVDQTGKQHGKQKNRLEFLRAQARSSRSDYLSGGIEIPDFTSIGNMSFMKTWEGDTNQLSMIKIMRLKPKLDKVESIVGLPNTSSVNILAETSTHHPLLMAIADHTGMSVDC